MNEDLYRRYEKLISFLNFHDVRIDDDGDLFFPDAPDDRYSYVTFREAEGKWEFMETETEADE